MSFQRRLESRRLTNMFVSIEKELTPILHRNETQNVILNGAQQNEESRLYLALRFFAEFILERSEGLRMTRK